MSEKSKIRYFKVFNHFLYRVPVLRQPDFAKDDFLSITNSAIFKEAVFLASPDLYYEMEKWISGNLKLEEVFRLELSLLKYYLRMSNRCTPFGLFAGCGVGSIGEINEVVLSSTEMHKSYTRLDMNLLCSLTKEIVSLKYIQKQIRYYPNTSLYESGSNYRYVEYSYLKNHRKHFLTSLQKDPYLELVIRKAEGGALFDDLVKVLACDDISINDAEEYIFDLINNQVLVSELEPTVSGNELLGQIIVRLKNFEQTHELVSQLEEIQSGINSIDNLPIGRPISLYNSVCKKIEHFNIPIDQKYLFQSDLYVDNVKATVDRRMVARIWEGIEVLNKLTPRYMNPRLTKFKEEFYKRYENEEIPLVEALDVETGIGFSEKGNANGDINPLVDDLTIIRHANSNQTVTITSINNFIQKKYEDFIADSIQQDIILTDDELNQFPTIWTDLPNTFGAMIELIKNGSEMPDINIQSVGGASAANLLGRFCHLNKDIEKLVMDIAQKERKMDSGRIVAEIIHLPESRTGNILFRPTIREFEIAYLANHSVDIENVIHVNDIMISVMDGKKIVLRSKKFNKEIIPRLSTAHNFSYNSLPIYDFLCSLQTQDIRGGVGFTWGPILDKKEYLPRVIYKNVILSPAIWNVTFSDIKKISKMKHENFIVEVERFRKEKNIPDKVLWVQGDNKLLIDFNHTSSVKLLFDQPTLQIFRLEEFLFNDIETFVSRGNETFTNQIILCFYKTDQNDSE